MPILVAGDPEVFDSALKGDNVLVELVVGHAVEPGEPSVRVSAKSGVIPPGSASVRGPAIPQVRGSDPGSVPGRRRQDFDHGEVATVGLGHQVLEGVDAAEAFGELVGSELAGGLGVAV
jgi:hypothetical protein